MGTITIRLDDEALEEIDDEWKEKDYNNRSSYLRYLIMMARQDNGGKEVKIDEYLAKRDEYRRKANRYEEKAEKLEEQLGKKKKKRERVKNEIQSYMKRQFRRNDGTLSQFEQSELVNKKIPEEYPVDITDTEEARKKIQQNQPIKDEVTNDESAQNLVDEWFEDGLMEV